MADNERQTYHVTKYPNRRLYDATSRQYVTLSELYEYVRAGHEIVVTDKTSGRDISNIVLTQIILEHDPPKMDLFPASLLHQAIQMNESMARSFIDRYLGQAMNAFAHSRNQFDAFLRQSGIPTMPSVSPPMEWLRMMMPGYTPPAPPSSTSAGHRHDEPDPTTPTEADEDSEIDALRRQVAELGKQMAELRSTPPAKSKPVRKKAATRRKKKK